MGTLPLRHWTCPAARIELAAIRQREEEEAMISGKRRDTKRQDPDAQGMAAAAAAPSALVLGNRVVNFHAALVAVAVVFVAGVTTSFRR